MLLEWKNVHELHTELCCNNLTAALLAFFSLVGDFQKANKQRDDNLQCYSNAT